MGFNDFDDGTAEGANVNIVDSNTPANSLKVNSNREISIADSLVSQGVQGALIVGTSAVEIKVGASPLALRKLVTLFNNSNSTLYWGYTSAVTVTTGTPIFKDQLIEWPASDSVTVYVIANSAGNNTRITEAS